MAYFRCQFNTVCITPPTLVRSRTCMKSDMAANPQKESQIKLKVD